MILSDPTTFLAPPWFRRTNNHIVPNFSIFPRPKKAFLVVVVVVERVAWWGGVGSIRWEYIIFAYIISIYSIFLELLFHFLLTYSSIFHDFFLTLS